MLQILNSNRTYDPETVAVMTAAFDEVCRSLSATMNRNEDVKQRLAEAILQRVDRGERDPMVIAVSVMDQLTGIRRSAAG